jgi:uncharacterized membrane protein YcaP (DUF421 family)
VPPDVQIFDLERMFLGEDIPPAFTLEIAFRTAFMYLYALLVLRLMGKRGINQLTAFDYAVIIALGSAVGDPMFYHDIPLLHGMVVMTVIVALERLLSAVISSSPRADAFLQGTAEELVRDGRLALDRMRREGMSREDVFTGLRQVGVEQLGQVKRAYVEESGQLSVFCYAPGKVRAGLPLVPPWDLEEPDRLPSGTVLPDGGDFACFECGLVAHVSPGGRLPPCASCGGSGWVRAVLDPFPDAEGA